MESLPCITLEATWQSSTCACSRGKTILHKILVLTGSSCLIVSYLTIDSLKRWSYLRDCPMIMRNALPIESLRIVLGLVPLPCRITWLSHVEALGTFACFASFALIAYSSWLDKSQQMFNHKYEIVVCSVLCTDKAFNYCSVGGTLANGLHAASCL